MNAVLIIGLLAAVLAAALAVHGVGSMLAAALVLALKSPAHRSAALKQGAFPVIAVVFLVLGLLH